MNSVGAGHSSVCQDLAEMLMDKEDFNKHSKSLLGIVSRIYLTDLPGTWNNEVSAVASRVTVPRNEGALEGAFQCEAGAVSELWS